MSNKIPPFSAPLTLPDPHKQGEYLHPAWRKWFQDLGQTVTNITNVVNVITGGSTTVNNFMTLGSSSLGMNDYVAEEPFFFNGLTGPQGLPGPQGPINLMSFDLDQFDVMSEASSVLNYAQNPYYNSSSFGNGSAAAPSINYGNAQTTGLYWANPGIGFSVGGTSIATIVSTGLSVFGNAAFTATVDSVNTLEVVNSGGSGANIALFGNGVTTPNKYVRSANGSFQVINHAYSAAILMLDDSGNFSVPGTITPTGALTQTVPGNVAASVPTVASGNTIAVTTPIAFISGVTLIKTITAPAGLTNGGQITLIPTGLWSTDATGNIALASTAVVSKALIMTYSASTSKWYPSY